MLLEAELKSKSFYFVLRFQFSKAKPSFGLKVSEKSYQIVFLKVLCKEARLETVNVRHQLLGILKSI
jgi:hypothetical protein